MRVLLVNTSERMGGAAVATTRLMEALKNNGIKVKLLVRDKQTDNISVVQLESNYLHNVWNFVWERILIWRANHFKKANLFAVDIANTGTSITSLSEFKEADIVHLHWINQGMLSLKNIQKILASGKPVVWTMHDMWPCTGICHHAYTCTRFKEECGNCRFLAYPKQHDLSYRVLKKKKNLYAQANIEFVVVSNWLASRVKDSTLLKDKNITIIPNPLPFDIFIIRNRIHCRQKLSLPLSKHILIFGAARIDADIKGFQYLIDSICYLINNEIILAEKLHLIIFGGLKSSMPFFNTIPVSYTYCGIIKDINMISELYSASNVVVSSSLYETFGQTLIEAMACGCMPVSFNNSGQTDIIDHKQTGFLAEYLSVESLAEGIRWAMFEAPKQISPEDIRKKAVTRYSESRIAKKYIEIYDRIISDYV